MIQTILLIDDFASVRLYHSGFLMRKGYQCLGAASGPEALALLEHHHVDLIMLDLLMPGMDGGTFIRHLDARPALTNIPVLMVTSEEDLARRMFLHSIRPLSVLTKPVLPTELLHRVQRMLPAQVPFGIAQ